MSKVVDTVAEARNGSSQNATQHYRYMFAIASRVTPSSSLLGKAKEVPVSIHSFETVRGILGTMRSTVTNVPRRYWVSPICGCNALCCKLRNE
jgi:hypothetical protein